MIHSVKNHSVAFARELHEVYLNQPESKKIALTPDSAEMLEALFLGTNGTNAPYLKDLLLLALQGHVDFRKGYYPADPDYINEEKQNSAAFQNTMNMMREEYKKLISQLQDSGTFYSMRSIGHMLWDTTIPGILGYFAALLYNQNNVAAEASPVTTLIEMQVGNELCKMLGYKIKPIDLDAILEKGLPEQPVNTDTDIAWGHITCDGSVANLEALWMARNLKFYAASVKAAMLNEPSLAGIKSFEVKLLDGSMSKLIDLDDWTILNLRVDDILQIPNNISTQFKIDLATLGNLVADYTIQNIGYHDMLVKYLPAINTTPVAMGPATKHYSWPKAAAVLGIGATNMWAVYVDVKARMDMKDLRARLDKCLATKTPVMNVVAVIGTTEESAVDPLKEILALREEYRSKGLEFLIHADAAWGGYFAAMLNDRDQSDPAAFKRISEEELAALPMSEYVTEQYKVLKYADSITIDPHKAGYVPYPAGGLCYRNSAMRNLVSFTAPVVYHGGVDPTVGVYGIEGSKPGAAACAVYFSHQVIRPNIDGYGKILSECLFNVKQFYASLMSLNIENKSFFIVPLVPIPAEQEANPDKAKVEAQYRFIKERIANRSNDDIIKDTEAYALFKELGGDQTIITYIYNFYNDDGTVNSDITKLNALNNAIYKKFSFSPGETDYSDTEIVVTSSDFTPAIYGDDFMNRIKLRLGIIGGEGESVNFIISTIMNPFLTNTVEGSFVPKLIDIITKNVEEIVTQIKKPSKPTV